MRDLLALRRSTSNSPIHGPRTVMSRRQSDDGMPVWPPLLRDLALQLHWCNVDLQTTAEMARIEDRQANANERTLLNSIPVGATLLKRKQGKGLRTPKTEKVDRGVQGTAHV